MKALHLLPVSAMNAQLDAKAVRTRIACSALMPMQKLIQRLSTATTLKLSYFLPGQILM